MSSPDLGPLPAADQAQGEEPPQGPSDGVPECPICIEPCVHPIELPCKHIFCYLCIKGVTVQASIHAMIPKCSICRRDIPAYVLTHPRLRDVAQLYRNQPVASDGYQWFYEARSGGWWQFEERLMVDLERSYSAGEPSCQLLIAGQMYDVDFVQMIQARVGNPNLFRRIKRDVSTAQKRGIAGIRTGTDEGSQSGPSTSGGRGQAQAPSESNGTTTNGTFSGPSGSGGPSSQHNSQQSTRPDSDEDPVPDGYDCYSSGDSDEVELSESDEDEEDDEYDGDTLRDGARAPTSRSDRSISAASNNRTPPPRVHKVGSRGSSRNTILSPVSPASATPPDGGTGSSSNGPTPSPTRPSVIVMGPNVRLTLDLASIEGGDEVL